MTKPEPLKRGLEKILDVVEAARVRIDCFDAIETPAQAATASHITDLLKQALVETKILIDQRIKLSSLSNAKGSRRIVIGDYALPKRWIEIRESMEQTIEESSMIFLRDEGANQPGSPVRLDATGLFNFAVAILSWFGYEAKPAPDHPDYAEHNTPKQIVEWLRTQAKKIRDTIEAQPDAHYKNASLEATHEDYDELARQIEAGAWRAKP